MKKKRAMKPIVSKTALDNGVRILTKKLPHVRSVSMGVWVNVGSRDEADDQSGLSHFIEHMIFKGTRRRSAYDIAKEFDAIGGHTNAFTSMEHTCYHAKVIDTHLETMIDILSDIFLNSVFDPREIDRERPVIFQEIGMVEDSPEEYAHILSARNFWGDNPLGRSILGTPQNISNFDSSAIKDFFKRFYQPDRIVITAAGNLQHERFVDLVSPVFESIHPGNGFPRRQTPKGRSEVCLHPKKIEQAHICVSTKGMPLTDPRRYAFSLMNTILGGNMSSRLFQEIREQRGLAYAIYSFIASHADTGMFGVYVGVDPKKIHEVIDLIFKEMRALKNNRLDSSELTGAKEFTKGGLLLSTESVDNQMVRLAQNEIYFGAQKPLKSIIDKIESIRADEIVDLAADLFQPDTQTLTILGPVSDTDLADNIPTF